MRYQYHYGITHTNFTGLLPEHSLNCSTTLLYHACEQHCWSNNIFPIVLIVLTILFSNDEATIGLFMVVNWERKKVVVLKEHEPAWHSGVARGKQRGATAPLLTSECCLSENINACRKIGWSKTANWSRTTYTLMLLYFTNNNFLLSVFSIN